MTNFRTQIWILFAAFTLVFSGCDQKVSDEAGTTATSSTGSGTASPTILGTPANSVQVGAAYSFHPTATVPEGGAATFSIVNQPSWTNFDATTGTLTGTPTTSDVGTFANIKISISDGGASVALPAFSITVLAASLEPVTLSWTVPQQNTDGSSPTNLAGYRIYYGSTPTNLNQVVTVEGNVTSYVLNQLAAGTWYFAVAAYNTAQVESALSSVVQLDLTG